ncbi:amidase family protein [Tardiphaga sp. 42S5]|uniref:amidase family protein n=1 Tax=Tardiphaga sp. 42S5 TaxID=1404799 RepID=UPI002A59E0AC|nr:amidase family protein [Tardiphaga sp. 42S5]WPO42194.1 amidase family protein [Tardiphaga sp. 42S5]
MIVAEACRRAQTCAADGVFTSFVPPQQAVERARQLQARADAGETLPLLGLPFSVKDSIHVAGMITTSNCPALQLKPEQSAFAVTRLEDAGAVLIGKNTLDQFATGLNGTRSPDPLCRNAIDPAYIPGGSSSGSAVAVARSVVAFSLGTDTGGSGRVPAACNGIVGLKPTIGLVSSRGLLYNNRAFDCIPVFARLSDEAYEILEHIAGFDVQDPLSRTDADEIDLRLRLPERLTLAIPRSEQLKFFGDDEARRTYESNLATLESLGHRLKPVDFTVFEEAGRLVFQSAMVAERLIDYADVVQNNPEAIHPAVWASIEPGFKYTARDALTAIYAMKVAQRQASLVLQGCDAMVVPTVPTIFTIEQMLSDPMALNTAMGTYTYFVNPLDMCAVAIPGRARSDGLRSSLCFVSRAGEDGLVRTLGRSFEGAVGSKSG